MGEPTTFLVDLRDIVRSLISAFPKGPDEIWLFGSRAQRTGSKRSDVDLLIVDRDAALKPVDLVAWRLDGDRDRDPLDLFVSRDGVVADSLINGSTLRAQTTLAEMLGAVLLWSRADGLRLGDEVPWTQEFRSGVTFAMTIIPTDYSRELKMLPFELERMGLPNTLLGTDWGSIVDRCADILAAATDATTGLQERVDAHLVPATAFPLNEYDAQNLFYLTLKPWLGDVEINPFQIKYAGQAKFADLAAARSQLVIGVKYVTDATSRAAVLKQLSGLRELYEQPTHTKAILFLILIAHGIQWDATVIDRTHSRMGSSPVVAVRSIRLPAPPRRRSPARG